MNAVELMRASFDAAVAAADPLRIVPAQLPDLPRGRVLVVGAGKAAASMALAVERAWAEVALDGIVITRYAHGAPTARIRVVEAGHPVPDAAGEAATREILQLTSQLQPGDLLLALISGGGSSLLSLPVPAVSMADLKSVTSMLLASGAPIGEMNIVRKHLSQIAGGRLAAAAGARGARVVALIISDVTGDGPSDIASGPCAPDPSTFADAVQCYRAGTLHHRAPWLFGCNAAPTVMLPRRPSVAIHCLPACRTASSQPRIVHSKPPPKFFV